MKRIANYLIALAVAAFTFTSCADVPSPFGDIVKPDSGDVVVIEPSGTGTEADPYNVAGVLEYISGLGADTPSPKEVYIKGYAVELTDISASYGNATFTISDNAEGTANKFTVYRAAGLGNQKVTDESFIKQGDIVVICGKVTNYKGNTPETVQGAAYVYSVNGKSGGGGATPATTLGTKDAPLTVAQALETINALADNGTTAQDAYVAGKITKIKTADADIDKYKNIDYIISDGTNELTVFRGKNIDNTDFTAAGQINVGDEVVVLGKLTKYVKDGNTTPEVAQGNYIVKLTKGSSGGDSNLGTKDAPLTVVKALEIINALADGGETADAYVKGTISQVTSYNSTYKSITYYISDDGKTTNELQVYSGKGLNGAEFAAKEDLSVGDQVVIKGKLKKYVKNGNVTPEINQSSEIVTITKASGGGNTGGGSVSAKATEMGFAAQAVATSYTMSDGTVLTFAKGDGSNGPKYYDGDYAAVRMYAKNMLTITSSKTIAKVVITTTSGSGSTKYNGNDTAFAEGSSKVTIKKNSDTEIEFSGLNAKTVKIVNDQEAASGGTQLRLSAITITYAN
jgi:exonuclease VII large subunit